MGQLHERFQHDLSAGTGWRILVPRPHVFLVHEQPVGMDDLCLGIPHPCVYGGTELHSAWHRLRSRGVPSLGHSGRRGM